jgi:hypothetical protein
MAIITPYDNKIGVWLVHGADVGETSIEDVAETILSYAPTINAVYVKTSDGADWMSRYDSKPALWIDGPAAIDRWVNALQKYGLEFHAWCVPRGLNIDAETNVIIQACQRPGVRSMILDVEPYQGFWAGGQSAIRPYMLKIRSAVPGSFHIAMSMDPRPNHYDEIFPMEWFPFVNSVLPQVYWADFQVSPTSALASAYQAWRNYGRPIFPVLSGYNTPPEMIEQGRATAVNQYKATGLSYWAFGHIGATHFAAINRTIEGVQGVPPPGVDERPVQYGTPITIGVGTAGYRDGVYDASKPGFTAYASANGGSGKFRAVDQGVANVWANYDPPITVSGWYKIEAFIPDQHATTGNARYKIHGIKGRNGEWIVSGAQSSVRNGWMTLGTFEIDATKQQAGSVFLNDWTFEIGREIAFDAIRWTPVKALTAQPVMIDVPYRSQESSDARRYRNDCGPACVAMYIDWMRKVKGLPPQQITIDQLASETALARNDIGLPTAALIPLATKYGVNLKLTNNATLTNIMTEVAAKRPPLVLVSYAPLTGRQNQADRGGHFVIVTGYDADNVYLNDPDWWNQGSTRAEQGHNWKVPIKQFTAALRQAEIPHQGLFVVS